jgi:hypothetical protein
MAEESDLSQDQKSPNSSQRTIEPQRDLKSRIVSRERGYQPERFWIPELLSLLLGMGSFIAILAVLKAFEGNLQPNWRHGITINAVVAVLATSLRSCLVVVAEEGEANDLFSKPIAHISIAISQAK